MVVSSARPEMLAYKPRPAGTAGEAVPLAVIPENNAAGAAASGAAGASEPETNGNTPGRRIGEILVDLGYVTTVQIDQALDSKEDAYARLGMRLLHKGVINEGQLAYAVSLRLGVGFTELTEPSETQPAAIAVVPDRIARRYSLIPLRIEGNVLVVAMSSPGNVYALDVVRAVTGFEVKPVAATEHAIRQALERCYGIRSDLQRSASDMVTTGNEEEISLESDESVAEAEQLRNEAEDAPVVKYVDSLIRDSIAERASDIHIEPGREAVSVRVRVDGRLRRTIPPPKRMQNAVISRIKILSRLDIAEKRLPLDGRMRAKFQGRDVDLRVSTLPSINGEKVVLRILDRSSVNLELNKIITDAAFLAHMQKILARQSGMILVTGPTGSGKTTTLYASLQYVKNVTKNVISVEDPIEYEVEGVTQVHARPEIGLTFARALRSILRQDPDIIMVGEMRDLETLEIGIRSSLTGHLVLSTIHTNDSVSTITRMVNMGTEPYLIASTLITAAAQRLVRSICPHCKEEYDLPDPVRARMHELLQEDIPKRLWRGAGCANCAGTGYRGRAAVFEYFHLDDEAKELVTRRAPEAELRAYQRKHASGSLLENALRKAIAGITTLEDAFELEMSI
ncbi:MAG: GspE/PulE family protein [Candidatus Brocadiia bacterium]|jgi:type IV pilus assembly protein PilB